MTKASSIKNPQKQKIPNFDFSDLSSDDEMALGMMSGLIEAYRHQQKIAIELTRLVVEKNTTENMSEEEVFSTFKRASHAVSEVSPIKELFEKIHG